MITPSYGLTATERVLPSFTLDWTTGLVQSTVDVTRAGAATFIGSNGLLQSAAENTQRIDYSTGTAGLLVEESRTNLCLYSEDLRNTADAGETRPWVYVNATIDYQPAGVTSPDGSANVCTLVENTATSTHYVAQNVPTTAGNFSYSIFAKDAGRRYLRMMFADVGLTSGSRVYATFDLQSGTANSGGITASNITTTVLPLSDGWYKCSISATITAGTQVSLALLLSNTSAAASALPSYEGDGVSGIYLFGSDNQVGLFPTSYIPTEASAVTRNADVATVTGTNFSDFFNAAEGTFLCEYQNPTTYSRQNNPIVRVDDGTNNNFISLATRNVASAATSTAIRLSGGATFQTTTGGVVTGTTSPIRMVGSYNASNIVHSANGVTPQTLAHDGVPTVNILRFNATNVGVQSNAAILLRTMAYYPFALTANEQQAFSK